MDSNNTVIGPDLDAGARVTTPAGRVRLSPDLGPGTPIVTGRSESQYASVKWNKVPDQSCRRENETEVSGHFLFILKFHLNYQDRDIAAADAMELEFYIMQPPEERSVVICRNDKGDVARDSNNPSYWYGSFVASHEQDRLTWALGDAFVFGLWDFPLGSPWATWTGPRDKRQGLVLHKDQTTFKLHHTPGI